MCTEVSSEASAEPQGKVWSVKVWGSCHWVPPLSPFEQLFLRCLGLCLPSTARRAGCHSLVISGGMALFGVHNLKSASKSLGQPFL